MSRLSIALVTVGRPSTLASAGVERYIQLLRPFAPVEHRIVKPCDKGSAQVVMRDEGERMLAQIKPGWFGAALAADGNLYDSAGYATWVGRHVLRGGTLAVFLGGAYGLSEQVRRQCKESVSLSRLTMAHDVALLVFLEQTYRAFTILRGHPYHK